MSNREGGCVLFFDLERAKKAEKRSRLSRAFSKIFRKKPASPTVSKASSSKSSTPEWYDVPLSSKSSLSSVGSSCKKFFREVFQSKSKPKPIQQTIPEQFGPAVSGSEEINLVPIKSSQDAVKKDDVAGQFQKLSLDKWRQDQDRMVDGTFPFPSGFTDKYKITSLIGEGSFGFVVEAERLRDGRMVAVKWALREKIPPRMWHYDSELGLVPTEVINLKQFSHPSIIQLLDYFDGGGDYICIVTELHGTEWTWPNPRLKQIKNIGLRPAVQLDAMKHTVDPTRKLPKRAPCDLFECIECHSYLPEQTVYRIFYQTLDAVLYLAELGWVHRDIKDENIVINEDYRIKIVDFGSATRLPTDGGLFTQFNGTLAFAAPEIIQGNWYDPMQAEVWTLGILLFTLAFKKAPFMSAEEILKKEPVEIKDTTHQLKDLISQMLSKDRKDRITIVSILRHPWMLKCRSIYP